MKRSEFLKKLGIGLGVAVVTPSVVSSVVPEKENSTGDEITEVKSELQRQFKETPWKVIFDGRLYYVDYQTGKITEIPCAT